LIDLLSLELQLREEELPLTSENLGAYLGTSGDSIRKDLSTLIGSSSRKHYEKRNLQEDLEKGLGLEKVVPICLVGLGYMGQQVLQWSQTWSRAELKVLFDTRINRLERMDQPIPAFPAWEIPDYLPGKKIGTAILATDPEEAEKNADRLMKGGIKTILNLSGYYLMSPQRDIRIKNLNILSELLALNCSL